MQKPIMLFQNLSFSLRNKTILERIDFSLYPGQFLIVIGPNGSGKSTLLKLAAGLIKPDRGAVRYTGTDVSCPVSSLQPVIRAKKIAYLPQNYGSVLPLSVEKNVLLGRTPWHDGKGIITGTDAKIGEEAMAAADLLQFRASRADRLSGGEKQRTAIARAFCQNPEIYLFDEPTASLDYRHQILIMEALDKKCRQGASAIMVCHDINLGVMYADSVVVLKKGKQKGCGHPQEILNSSFLADIYETAFLADLHPETHTLRLSLRRSSQNTI